MHVFTGSCCSAEMINGTSRLLLRKETSLLMRNLEVGVETQMKNVIIRARIKRSEENACKNQTHIFVGGYAGAVQLCRYCRTGTTATAVIIAYRHCGLVGQRGAGQRGGQHHAHSLGSFLSRRRESFRLWPA